MPGPDPQEISTDDSLMRRAGQGVAAAFTRLVSAHARRTAALAARFMGGRGEAEEIVQEAFTRLWLKAPDWQPGGAQVSTWLHRVVVNLCLDRKRRPRSEALDAALEVEDPAPRGDALVIAEERRRRVRHAIDSLPERQRAALMLCHFEEMSNIEAAAILDIGVGAVESLLVRARRALRDSLQDHSPDPVRKATP